MPVNQVVINASPLILLFNSQLSFILADLFDEIVAGDPIPSPEDIQVTKTIKEARMYLEIQLLDHLVIGFNR